jgi:hypothetical protein
VNHNHGGSEARRFDAYTHRAGFFFPKILAAGRFHCDKRNRVTSVVVLRTFADSPGVPVVVVVRVQQQYLAKPRLPAISEIDRALDNSRKVLDHSRGIGMPVAFIRMLNESASFNRATPFVRWVEGFEPYRNEMVFERASPSEMQASDVPRAVSKISGIYGEVYDTTDWIASTLPRKLDHGKSAGG